MIAMDHFQAGGALFAGIILKTGIFTIQRPGKGQRQGFFADGVDAAEDIGMADPMQRRGFLKHADLFGMAVNICKRHWRIKPSARLSLGVDEIHYKPADVKGYDIHSP